MTLSLPHLVDVKTSTGTTPGAVRIHNLMCRVYPQMGKVASIGTVDDGQAWSHVLITSAGVDIRGPGGVFGGVSQNAFADYIELPIGSGQYYRALLTTRPFYLEANEYTKVFLCQDSALWGTGVKWQGP